MNYKNIHIKAIEYFTSTTPKYRLSIRNPMDERLNMDKIYTEKHHIIPRHNSGKNDDSNLVVLLPEEHIFIHQIRYKAFNDKNDMLAVRFCLNGYSSKPYRGEHISKHILAGYAWIRQQSYNFRIEHGWQTPNGRKRISESRKGKMPVVDAKTRKVIGSVYVNHPKVISGEWIHHSKGSKLSDSCKDKLSRINAGHGNANALDITDTEIIDLYIESYDEFGFIISYSSFIKWAIEIKDTKIPKTLRFRFDRKGIKEIHRRVENITNDKYVLTKPRKNKIFLEKMKELKERKNDKN